MRETASFTAIHVSDECAKHAKTIEHLKNPDTRQHEVVLFGKRQRQLPEQKCEKHPTKDVGLLCQHCQIPICSECKTEAHQGHAVVDFYHAYSNYCAVCLDKISEIEEYFLPTTGELQKETKADASKIKNMMEKIRTSMTERAESLKVLVDKVASNNKTEVDEMEHSLLKMLNLQDKTYEDHISYLRKLNDKLYYDLSCTDLQILKITVLQNLKIEPIPETTRPVPPVFSADQCNEEDVIKLLGKLILSDENPEVRNIMPMKTDTKQAKNPEKQGEKSDVKLSLPSDVTQVREYIIQGVKDVFHLSVYKSGILWASDLEGKLVQDDSNGVQLQKIETGDQGKGFHAVTSDGYLMYAVKNQKVVVKTTLDNKITGFISTKNWKPLSIHYSRINGDILVGMRNIGEAKITRFNRTGEIQDIQRTTQGMCCTVFHTTSQKTCTSDINYSAVVVVNNSGQYRFSYTGLGPEFRPYGICTDVLGHILVCDNGMHCIHVLNQDGEFLSLILAQQQGIDSPCSLCVDDENYLYVGQRGSNLVKVFQYIQ